MISCTQSASSPIRRPRAIAIVRAITAFLGLALVCGVGTLAAQEEEEDVRSLYEKAGQLAMEGRFAEASQTYERMIEVGRGVEGLVVDYGAAAGGMFFEYGTTLLPQGRWEEAEKAFLDCLNVQETVKEVQTIVETKNVRENLARYQLGYCKAQMGDHETALKFYNEFLENKPSEEELAQVRTGFKLRMGVSLMKTGKVDEGIDMIEEVFTNREEWNVAPQDLMQGILDVGLHWAEAAENAGGDAEALAAIAERAHGFLDKYAALVVVPPLEQFRFGYVDRLRKLGLESTIQGLPSLALRYFSFVPTVADIREDMQMRLEQLPMGADVPSQYQALIDRIDERDQADPHPDFETLLLVANCHDRLGDYHAARGIYWYLAEHFPAIDAEKRAEILHEAARISSLIADYPSAQYFGDKFMAEMPEDHKLRDNISAYMLQSLFTERKFDQVIETGERVRERYDPGAQQREMADALYPMALYFVERHEDAEEPFGEYVSNYPDGNNREMVMFHRGSNSLVLGKMRPAAEQLEDFLKEYPESERFLDTVVADLALARYNLEDYSAAIAASEKLEAERPGSDQLPRTLILKGDAYSVQHGNATAEQEEEKEQWRQDAMASYLAATDAAEKTLPGAEESQKEYFRNIAGTGLWKAADLHYQEGENEEGLALYDRFFPDYEGTDSEPQLSVFSLEALEAADRGEEGLAQVEKMINLLGNQPPEEQDVQLLRQAIGSWSEASVRIRGVEDTIARLDEFPGLDPQNKALLTWLKIQKVIVLQESRKGMQKDSPEYAAVETQIADVFEELRLFEKADLSEFALQQIGIYLATTDNPFLAVPYFEELLGRTNPEADAFKAPAEMEIGKIEMRSPEKDKLVSARERFKRVIKLEEKDKVNELTPEAYLNLGRLHFNAKEWDDAVAALQVINKNRKWLERNKRAEATFLLGRALDENGDNVGASKAYLSVFSTYLSSHDWATQAFERYVANAAADIAAMPEGTPVEQAAKRKRELALYGLMCKYIFMWQKLTDEDASSGALARLRRQLPEMKQQLGITEEEQAQVDRKYGLDNTEGK